MDKAEIFAWGEAKFFLLLKHVLDRHPPFFLHTVMLSVIEIGIPYSYGAVHFILSSSKELTSWVKLQVEIFCKASRRRTLQKTEDNLYYHPLKS